jgi:hypothetical protein
MLWKITEIMNNIKGFSVGYSIEEKKMLIDFDGRRYVAEIREVEHPAENALDDMRRIRYL